MKNKTMRQIAEFIDQKAKEQLRQSPKAAEILKAKAILKKYSTQASKEVTFTVGEANAYLG